MVALGVGVGVDYGIYIYNRLTYYLKQGLPMQEAYYRALSTTGRAVAFTGLALGVGRDHLDLCHRSSSRPTWGSC